MVCTLYYIHDPMCSWCYAFAPALQALQQSLPPRIALQKVVGGLAPDTQQPMPEETRQYVQSQWRRIEQQFPQIRFNFAFWSENTPIRSTYPACRAVLAAKQQGEQFEALMIENIQDAYYRQAKNPALAETLMACAHRAGVDMEKFAADFSSPAIHAALQNDLRLAASMGVTSFPSLRLCCNGNCAVIECRYDDAAGMLAQILQFENQLHRSD